MFFLIRVMVLPLYLYCYRSVNVINECVMVIFGKVKKTLFKRISNFIYSVQIKLDQKIYICFGLNIKKKKYLGLFCRYYFCRCLSELDQLVSLPYSRRRSTSYSVRLHDSSFTIP